MREEVPPATSESVAVDIEEPVPMCDLTWHMFSNPVNTRCPNCGGKPKPQRRVVLLSGG